MSPGNASKPLKDRHFRYQGFALFAQAPDERHYSG
jgi:hypothetical protein